MYACASVCNKYCYVEESTDADLCSSNMDCKPINTADEMDGATGVT